MPPPVAHSYNVSCLLDRMTSADKDFRFMATNDLMGLLNRDHFRMDDHDEAKVTQQIISLLRDKNGEVQNLAVKCLSALIATIKDERRQLVIGALCSMLNNNSDQIRDISSIALKSIVASIPMNRKTVDIISDDLIPDLLKAINDPKQDVNIQLESLDIIGEVISRVGSQLGHNMPIIQVELIKKLNSERSAVRKRSINALANLLSCCPDDLYNETVSRLSQAFNDITCAEDAAQNDVSQSFGFLTQSKSLLHCFSAVMRSAGHRMSIEQANQILPVIFKLCQAQDDELREYCLQAFESYIRHCVVSAAQHIPSIISICLTSLAYDPNYNYEEDDGFEDDTMETDGQDDDLSDSADEYSDDDDLSWKVRRASAKCLEAAVTARRDMLTEFFSVVAPVLLARFKEREDSIRADIIQTFVALLKQTRTLIVDPKLVRHPAALELQKMIPVIVKRSSNILKEKSIKTRQIVFQMLSEIMHILPSPFNDHIAPLSNCIMFSIVDKKATANSKIEALILMQEFLSSHKVTINDTHVKSILPVAFTAVDDAFYKISAEALMLLSRLVYVMRPDLGPPIDGYEPILSSIHQKTLDKMSRSDLDLEIRERAVTCMGAIIATFGDLMHQQTVVALNAIHEKLDNDSTRSAPYSACHTVELIRLTCLKALSDVLDSGTKVPLDSIFPRAFVTLSLYLKSNSRPLKISTLILLEKIFARSIDIQDTSSIQLILKELPPINDADLYIAQLNCRLLATMFGNLGHRTDMLSDVLPQKIIPEAIELIQSPLLQGSALNAVLSTLKAIVPLCYKNHVSGMEHETVLNRLVAPIYSGSPTPKQVYMSTAKAIASISTSDHQLVLTTINRLVNDIHTNGLDFVHTLALLSIGAIGKEHDLSAIPGLIEIILSAFNNSSEEVKSAGSFALGSIAVASREQFLPVILREIDTRSRGQYLILHSLREAISEGALAVNKDQLFTSVWQLLIRQCECHEEGTRNVVSECLGKLTSTDAALLLPQLISYFNDHFKNNPLAKSTIVAAIKFFDEPTVSLFLHNNVQEFLLALQDEDINVRRVALITFNSIVHSKQPLIVDVLAQVLPLLYRQTLINQSLIREVEMGPFKHQVDDGLDTRKAAFECMYTLLDTFKEHIDIYEFIRHVEHGLTDHYDIKLLNYLMLNRLAVLCPKSVLQRIKQLLQPIETVCRSKPKENAVKQEHEKQDELKRSALRAFDALRSIPNADRHPLLVEFYETYVTGDRDLAELYNSIHRDCGADVTNKGDCQMDTS